MLNAHKLMNGLGDNQMKYFSLLTLMEYQQLYEKGHNTTVAV
jgi:hypothetical protein